VTEPQIPQSYFLYDTLRQRKEIYRMDEEMLRRKEVEDSGAQ